MSAAGLTNDGVVRGLLGKPNLKVSVTVCTQAAREGARRHGLKAVSAALLGQATAGALLTASLQKGDTRLNLQVEVDGPLRGLFVDAGTDGDVRGYVKNPHLDVELGEGPFRWRAAMGNSGFLSVLRDMGNGEYYRSAIELRHHDLARDLAEYFHTSDQVPTCVALEVRREGDEPLGRVAGVMVQLLPDGDRQALEDLRAALPERLREALATLTSLTPASLLAWLFPDDCEVMASVPVQWKCTCSRERALNTIASLGLLEVQDILDTMGSTAVTCQFCATKHEVSFQDLVKLVHTLEVLEAKAKQNQS